MCFNMVSYRRFRTIGGQATALHLLWNSCDFCLGSIVTSTDLPPYLHSNHIEIHLHSLRIRQQCHASKAKCTSIWCRLLNPSSPYMSCYPVRLNSTVGISAFHTLRFFQAPSIGTQRQIVCAPDFIAESVSRPMNNDWGRRDSYK